MMDIRELIDATGWTGIFMGSDCPVLRFSIADMRKIRGLKRNEHTLYLDYPEFKYHPISFMVTDDSIVTQYFVVGDRLHRSDGPAKIISNPKGVCLQEYYYNGLPHRTDGPAIIEYDNLRLSDECAGVPVPSSIMCYTYSAKRHFYWRDGQPCRYPLPHSAQFSDGQECMTLKNGEWVVSDSPNFPHIQAEGLLINWHSPRTGEAFIRQLDIARPVMDHNLKLIECEEVMSLHWVDRDEVIDFNEEQRDRVKSDFLPVWNLLSGPVFTDELEETLFFVLVSQTD